MNKCIYCNKISKYNWKPEHVIPRAFGAFENAPTLLKTVCNDCNDFLGKLDELLARNSIEGCLRHIKGVHGRKKHNAKDFLEKKTQGKEPPEIEGILYSNNQYIEPFIKVYNNEPFIKNCIVLKKSSDIHKLCIPSDLNEQEIFDLISRHCSPQEKLVRIFAENNEKYDLIKNACEKYFDIKQWSDPKDIFLEGSQAVPITIKGRFDSDIAKSIIKIALNYFIWVQNEEIEIYRNDLKNITNYIRGEDSTIKHIKYENRPILCGYYETKKFSAVPDCYKISCETINGNIMIKIQLLSGVTYQVKILENNFLINSICHVFFWKKGSYESAYKQKIAIAYFDLDKINPYKRVN